LVAENARTAVTSNDPGEPNVAFASTSSMPSPLTSAVAIASPRRPPSGFCSVRSSCSGFAEQTWIAPLPFETITSVRPSPLTSRIGRTLGRYAPPKNNPGSCASTPPPLPENNTTTGCPDCVEVHSETKSPRPSPFTSPTSATVPNTSCGGFSGNSAAPVAPLNTWLVLDATTKSRRPSPLTSAIPVASNAKPLIVRRRAPVVPETMSRRGVPLTPLTICSISRMSLTPSASRSPAARATTPSVAPARVPCTRRSTRWAGSDETRARTTGRTQRCTWRMVGPSSFRGAMLAGALRRGPRHSSPCGRDAAPTRRSR